KAADDAVGNGFTLELDLALPAHHLLGVLDGFLDGGRHFVGLAVTASDASTPVADHHQGVKTETAASLDHGGATPDLDDPFFHTVLPHFSISCHTLFPEYCPFSGGSQNRAVLRTPAKQSSAAWFTTASPRRAPHLLSPGRGRDS